MVKLRKTCLEIMIMLRLPTDPAQKANNWPDILFLALFTYPLSMLDTNLNNTKAKKAFDKHR